MGKKYGGGVCGGLRASVGAGRMKAAFAGDSVLSLVPNMSPTIKTRLHLLFYQEVGAGLVGVR